MTTVKLFLLQKWLDIPNQKCRWRLACWPLFRARQPCSRPSVGIQIDGNGAVFTCRTIDGLNGRNVAQSLHPIRFRIAAEANAVREAIEFQNELIDHFEFSFEPSTLNLAKQTTLLFERKRGVQRGPTLLAVDLDEGSSHGAVT